MKKTITSEKHAWKNRKISSRSEALKCSMQSPQTFGYCLSQPGILLQIQGLRVPIEGLPIITRYHNITMMLEEFQGGS